MKTEKVRLIHYRVQVKPRSKQEGVTQGPDGVLVIAVNAPPVDGKANKRVIELLAKHLGTSKSQITLLRGEKSNIKHFCVEDRESSERL